MKLIRLYLKRHNSWSAVFAATGWLTRKVTLMIVLAVVLLGASSARAVIYISANEVGGNVAFTLSGSLDLKSLDQITETFHSSSDFVEPQTHSGAPPGIITRVWFGTPGPSNVQVNEGRLTNLTGPSFFGPDLGHGGVQQPSNNTGSIFGFIKFTPNSGLGTLDFPISYTSLSQLSASMSFTGTFSSIGMTPGTYQWDWFNSSTNIHDSLVLQIGVPEPSATMLMIIGLAALGWLCRKIGAET